jgi:GNAT superfamily N-acetyltransferase
VTDDTLAFSFRRAAPDDIDAVLRLRLALLHEYPEHPIYGRLHPNAEALARPVFAAQLASGNEAVFLAERADDAIGVLRAVEAAAAPFLVPDRYCYVSSVFVVPAFRRQGVLRGLLDRAMEWAGERGLGELRLHSVGTRANASGAWDALGFDVVEQVRIRRVDAHRSARMQHGLNSGVSGDVRPSSRRPSGGP